MPHNRFFIDHPLTAGEEILLQGDEHHHMTKVMRLKEGAILEIVNGKGYLGKALLTLTKPSSITCLLQEVVFETLIPSFIIAQAILKPSSLELTIEKNTELGAQELWVFPGIYSEKKELSTHQYERLQRHTIAALKQCGRLHLPKITLFSSLEELLSHQHYRFLYGDISPSAPPLHPQSKDDSKLPVFIVGPEQGLHEKELLLLKERDAKGVSLHRNILRAETASITASALLSTI